MQFLRDLLDPVLSCLSRDLSLRPSAILNRMIIRAPKLLTIKESRLKAAMSVLCLGVFNVSAPEDSGEVKRDRILHILHVPLGFTTVTDYSNFFFKYPRLLVLPLSVLSRLRFLTIFSNSNLLEDKTHSHAYIYRILSSFEFPKINFTLTGDILAEFLSCNTNEFFGLIMRYVSIECSDLDFLYYNFLSKLEKHILNGDSDEVHSANFGEHFLLTLPPAATNQNQMHGEYQERRLCGLLNDIFDLEYPTL